MRVLEFFGMAGAGKTTIARAVQQRLQQEGLLAISGDFDDWIDPAAVGLPPVSVPKPEPGDWAATAQLGWRLLRLAGSIRPWEHGHLGRARLIAGWYRRTRYLERLGTEGVAIQDEAVLHRQVAMVMHGTSHSAAAFDALTRHYAREPHRLFIHVQTDPKTVLQRRRRRSGLRPGEPARLYRYQAAEAEQEWQVQQALAQRYQEIDRAVTAVAADRKITVCNDSNTDAAVEQSLAFILARCGRQASQRGRAASEASTAASHAAVASGS